MGLRLGRKKAKEGWAYDLFVRVYDMYARMFGVYARVISMRVSSFFYRDVRRVAKQQLWTCASFVSECFLNQTAARGRGFCRGLSARGAWA